MDNTMTDQNVVDDTVNADYSNSFQDESNSQTDAIIQQTTPSTDPLQRILDAEAKKNSELEKIARESLNQNGKTREEIAQRYPKSPFDR